MGTKRSPHKDEHPQWKGDAVLPQPGDTAERAADRAEGKQPIRVDALRHDSGAEPQVRASPPTVDPEEAIADAGEEHRERRALEGHSPRGKL
jgi:hypothetical protein